MAIVPISLQTLALILIVITIIKLVVILVKPKAWAGITKGILNKPIITMIVGLVLAYLSLDILREAGISYVQILAVMFFLAMLMIMSYASYAREFLSLTNKVLRKGVLKRSWLPLLVWLALIVLALNEIYAFW
jgi:hypothetical protein